MLIDAPCLLVSLSPCLAERKGNPVMNELWPWLTVALLGAYHGINPAMGWLFAVALGLQERRRSAVLRAFAPIALGHAASVAAVVALVSVAQAVVTPEVIRGVGAAVLIGYGGVMLVRGMGHPRWVGMRVGFRDLTLWSFLMSSVHGAGLMLVPVLLQLPGAATAYAAGHDHTAQAASFSYICGLAVPAATLADGTLLAIHSVSMFAVMAVIAMVVYEFVGLAILRRAWLNLDRVWAGALVAAGVIAAVVH